MHNFALPGPWTWLASVATSMAEDDSSYKRVMGVVFKKRLEYRRRPAFSILLCVCVEKDRGRREGDRKQLRVGDAEGEPQHKGHGLVVSHVRIQHPRGASPRHVHTTRLRPTPTTLTCVLHWPFWSYTASWVMI